MKTSSKLTAEQIEIVNSHAKNLEVQAFAGTGKTTVLQAYAAARTNKRILYLAFNRVTAEEARRRFGPNVTCKTTHSLAWCSHGDQYKHKLGDIRERTIMSCLRVDPIIAALVQKTVESFLHSASPTFLSSHLPKEAARVSNKQSILDGAECLWKVMQDVERPDVPMPHDGYLKLYALSRPDLSRRYDIILFDEAQDANPVTADLLRAQRKCGLVFVGDAHQAIYSFRGAVNALSQSSGAIVLPLTQSFRFGREIGALASMFLSIFKNEPRMLEGCATDRGVFNQVDSRYPMTYLSRTNAALFRKAFTALGRERLHFLGGVQSYPFDKLLDVYRLANNETPKDGFYANFSSSEELEAYARVVGDRESLALLYLVEKYRNEVPLLVRRVKSEAITQREDASLVLSTTHRAKGQEFRQVRLANKDFEPLLDSKGAVRQMNTEELIEAANLHYVAMTRATHVLLCSSEICEAAMPMLSEYKKRQGVASAATRPS